MAGAKRPATPVKPSSSSATAGEPWADYDWDNWRERTFRPAAAAADLPASADDGANRVRPRDLRSSFATLLIYAGQPPQSRAPGRRAAQRAGRRTAGR